MNTNKHRQPDLFAQPSPTLTLRPYQEEAVKKLLWCQQLEGNDICVLPTGAGKSVVIAHLAKQLHQPILILQPSKEILEQNYTKLLQYVSYDDIGVYSASVNRKDISTYTFATIQSIYKKPDDFAHFGMVIIDECHAVNQKNEEGMFTSFLNSIGNPKVVGFTATPYRMATMYKKSPGSQFATSVTTIKLINRMKPFFWNRISYNINISQLLDEGYLCPLEYLDHSIVNHEDIPLNKTRSDFDLDSFSQMIHEQEDKVIEAVAYAQASSKSVLVFCSSVEQAYSLSEITYNSEVVSSRTNTKERDAIIKRFKSGETQVVYNMGVLTTGFDHPSLDCIVMLRPTRSIALYYQMLGRGVRTAPGKQSCKVIDLTSNVKNIGRVETIKLERKEKWELTSERGLWHNRELYSYRMKRRATEETNDYEHLLY